MTVKQYQKLLQVKGYYSGASDGFCDGYPAPLAEQLVYILNSLRRHYGQPIYVTSGLRCPRHNANLGGIGGSCPESTSAV